ncbi:MAG TPA: hypothetical protein VGM62_12610 [Chthoniobacterales bacterium]|jgi:hypothetical protein
MPKFGMIFARLSNFHRTKNRRLGVVAKHQGSAIAGRQAKKFAFGFRAAELIRSADNLFERLQLLALLTDQQL